MGYHPIAQIAPRQDKIVNKRQKRKLRYTFKWLILVKNRLPNPLYDEITITIPQNVTRVAQYGHDGDETQQKGFYINKQRSNEIMNWFDKYEQYCK